MFFPSIGAFLLHYLCFIPSGFMFCYTMAFIITRFRRRSPQGRSVDPYVILALFPLLLNGLFIILFSFSVLHYFQQRLDVRQVTMIQVERFAQFDRPTLGSPHTITDPLTIRAGMEALVTARVFTLEAKGHYPDGYRLRLHLRSPEGQERQATLLFYRSAPPTDRPPDVVVFVGANTWSYYVCRACQQWMQTAILPLFEAEAPAATRREAKMGVVTR